MCSFLYTYNPSAEHLADFTQCGLIFNIGAFINRANILGEPYLDFYALNKHINAGKCCLFCGRRSCVVGSYE